MANDKTNNTQDSELLELCKQVYEATRWEVSNHPVDWYHQILPDTVGSPHRTYPRYNSDFLLDKLPKYTSVSQMRGPDTEWLATCSKFHPNRNPYIVSDTPLKALLKLCLTLNKEGLL